MSTAARKERKRIRRRWGYESAEATQSYPIAGPYQHPTREGIPYGRSKQPNPMAGIGGNYAETAAMVAAARESWPKGGGW